MRRCRLALGMFVMSACAVLLAACGGSMPGAAASGDGLTGAVRHRAEAFAHGCCTLIAHAGGSVDGNPYTNSREALLLSIEAGFRLVELDFSMTRDGDWFTTHDWEYWAKRTGYKGTLPPTTQAVRERKSSFGGAGAEMALAGTYTTLSLDELVGLLADRPAVKVITDTKSDEATLALVDQLESTPTFAQFVFQSYSLEGLQRAAEKVPARQLSLTTYQMDWFSPGAYDKAFLSAVGAYPDLYSFTIPLRAAIDEAKMARIKAALAIPIWTHGPPSRVNSRNLQTQLSARGVHGLFVD